MLAVATHPATLVATVAVSLTAALVFGFLARRVGLSPIVGYMLAGLAVGPHTPGFVVDAGLAQQLAEIGIALLMFGVGLHFSLQDLLAVRSIAVPGALGQSAVATGFGVLVAWCSGWGLATGLVFGLALSVASTVVLVRGLEDQRLLHSPQGHVAIGWLVVEDLLTVFVLLALPTLATGDGHLLANAGAAALKLAGLGLAYAAGVRAVPWFLARVAALQSRELFTLAVLGIALGVAYGASELFSVSIALGAFLGGMVIGQSELSHQAAADALPLRDAFAVLFFVAVGMLFDPHFVLDRPGLVAATLGIVLLVKPLLALAIAMLAAQPVRTGLTVGVGLAQIGEFSFIVAGLGRDLGVLPADAQQAIVAAALLSIGVNPLLFRLVEPLGQRLRAMPALGRWLADRPRELARVPAAAAPLRDHAVLCGHGRTGSVLARLLRERQWPLLVIEQDRPLVQRLRREGTPTLHGDAANPFVLERAELPRARLLLVTLPDALATRQIVAIARALAPGLPIVARVHAESEREHLERQGGVEAVLGELELAIEMARHTLQHFGVSPLAAQAAVLDLRRGRASIHGGAQVLEVEIASHSPAAGKRLAELGLGSGVLVMAIDRHGSLLVPDGQTRVAIGDRLLIVAGREAVATVHAAL